MAKGRTDPARLTPLDEGKAIGSAREGLSLSSGEADATRLRLSVVTKGPDA
jgi:hypothetical protein